MEQKEISVRELVEFTFHGEDICPANFRAMQEGSLGHKARQKNLPEGWKAEVTVELHTVCEEYGMELTIRGRMDAYREQTDESIPQIEEMKLHQGKVLPEEPRPEHFAQAACYAHMVMAKDETIDRVKTIVSYISRQGKVKKNFEVILDRTDAADIFSSFLTPYLQWQSLIAKHKESRDKSVKQLKFPFPQYRAGQREMSVQVYTAILRGKRLFAQMPTGTGKSMATIFPAVKALGEGKTERIYYLTSRTTQRKSALEAVEMLRNNSLDLWTLVINAKSKQCPTKSICNPDFCPRAKGHFLRDREAIMEIMETGDFSAEKIEQVCSEHQLCPFEFSLSLAEIADLTVCDYNYALDPKVHIQRIFDTESSTTLLIDEAHNLPSRLQDMTSATLNAAHIRELRTYLRENGGKKTPAYETMTEFLAACDDVSRDGEKKEWTIEKIPQSLESASYKLLEALSDLSSDGFSWGVQGETYGDAVRSLVRFKWVMDRDKSQYAIICRGDRNLKLTMLALDVGEYFAGVTENMAGTVCFSATLSPLDHIKTILGGESGDAVFAMPSPFPKENLLVLSRNVDTKFAARETTARQVAAIIDETYNAHPGRYIAFFPSFAYMEMVEEKVTVPHQVQEKSMTDAEREEFLQEYRQDGENTLSLCVMGGAFSEGIDLPGDALTGVVVVGVGMPQVNIFQEKMMAYCEGKYGSGFLHTYMIPGIQKVTQAVGRVIRRAEDRGVAILVDERYRRESYRSLCPEWWEYHPVNDEQMAKELALFWGNAGDE